MVDGYFVTPRDAEQIEMHPGIHRRTLATTDEVMLCEFFLERHTLVPEHSHMNDQTGYVVFGRLEMTIGGEVRVLKPGDSYAIPGGVRHSLLALVDTLEISAFSPPRADYRTEAR
ncbi:MAG: cupin [Anaerolineaceae bacterium]|nr:cupin [Anaerolineaceae bacterium]